jgi:xanthine dehydrogenase small subunit
MRSSVTLRVNENIEFISGKEAFLTLSDFLRNIKYLIGTKVVCSEGDCGACTVLIKRPGEEYFKSVNSCILPIFLLDQCHIITTEGLKRSKDTLYKKIHNELFKHLGTQCGFCTPGFIMQIRAMCEEKNKSKIPLSSEKMISTLSGNLCRCTGYKAILEVTDHLLSDKANEKELLLGAITEKNVLEIGESVLIKTEDHEVFIAVELQEALKYKQKNPQAMIVSGATDLSIKWNKGFAKPEKILVLHLIKELFDFKVEDKSFRIGSLLTLNEITKKISNPEISHLMNRFASEQIRNIGTLAGNIINASPIGDTLPLLYILNAKIIVQSCSGSRTLPIQNFILDYRKTALKADEIVTGIILPQLPKEHFLVLEKVSRRHFLDISSVTFAGMVNIKNNRIENLKLVYGGVGPVVLDLDHFTQTLLGLKWERKTFQDHVTKVSVEIKPRTDFRASAQYREKVSQNLFLNFFEEVEKKRMGSRT